MFGPMFGLFEKLLDPFARDIEWKHIEGIKAFLHNQIRELRSYVFLVVFFSTCMALSEVYLFNLLGKIIDSLVSLDAGQKSYFWWNNKWLFVQACFVLFLCLPFVVLMHSLIINQTLSGSLQTRIMSQINEFLLKQNLPYFLSLPSGKLAATILQLSGATRYVLLKSIDIVVYIFVFIVSASLFIVKANWLLLAPVFLWAIGYAYAMFTYLPELKKRAAGQADKRSDVSANLVDVYTNISTVKLFQGEDHEVKFSRGYLGEYLKSLFLQMRVISKIAFTYWGLNVMLIFFSATLCLYYWSISLISVGIVSGIIALILRLYTMSHWVIWEVSGLSEQLGVINNSLTTIRPTQSYFFDNDTNSFPTIDNFSISFNSVFFGFDASKLIFKDLNLKINSKEKIGIVGESGSGKSTLIKLLMGFRPVDAGSIRIGEEDIRSLQPNYIARNISVVSQDLELLNRSILDNIAYAAKDATLDQVVAAAKMACAHDFIESLEDAAGNKSYDYIVGEKGSRLSGGQKQRIALARAILKNAPILILDEATSALDSLTEHAIVTNLQDFIKDKTVIFITHRMSSVRHMDRIVVMQGGSIEEIGSHEHLIKLDGIYNSLWNTQMNYSVRQNATTAMQPEYC